MGNSGLYHKFPYLYLPVVMTCDQQIKNSSDLLHVDTITVPLGGVMEDRVAPLSGFNHIIITLLDGLSGIY